MFIYFKDIGLLSYVPVAYEDYLVSLPYNLGSAQVQVVNVLRPSAICV